MAPGPSTTPSTPTPKAPPRQAPGSSPSAPTAKGPAARRSDPFTDHVGSAAEQKADTKAAPSTPTPPASPRARTTLTPKRAGGAPNIQTAAHVGVPAIIWDRESNPAPTAHGNGNGNGVAAEAGGAVVLPPPSPVESPADPFDAPDPHKHGDCEVCDLSRPGESLTRCPVCRRETCSHCTRDELCAVCVDLRIPDASERAILAPLYPPADGVRISSGDGVRIVTIQSGPRRELAIMQNGAIDRWWRADRAEPNHYRVNRALESRLGLRDAATLEVRPLLAPGGGESILEVGGEGRLVAEVSAQVPGGGSTPPESITLEATPPGPSGLLRALAEQLNCHDDAVPWVIPAGMRDHFERLVAPTSDASAAHITLAPEVRRSGVRVGSTGLLEANGHIAPFAPVEHGSAPLLGGRLSEWFPRPRVVSAARGLSGSAVLLEVGGTPVLAVQDGDDVSYHASAIPTPSPEEILGGALNPDRTPAQASATINPIDIAASPVSNAELTGRRARPVARPSLDWANAEATAAAIAHFRLEQAVRTPEITLDLPEAVTTALKTEILRGGVQRPDVLEVGAEVHEQWSGRESESEFVYSLYPADLGEPMARPELTLDDEGHLATHARLCAYCGTTRCDECDHLVRSCIVCKVDLCAGCRGPAAIGLPVCPACSSLEASEAGRRFGRRAKGVESLVGADGVHDVHVERREDEWFLVAEDGSRMPIARDYRVAGFLERRLDD